MRKLLSAREIVVFASLLTVGFCLGAAFVGCRRDAASRGGGGRVFSPRVAEAADSGVSEEAMTLRRTPVVAAVEKVGPAVVNISTEKIVERRHNPFGGMNDQFLDKFFDNYFDMFPTEKFKQITLGSGVIIDPKGYILTNDHVILRASKVMVTLPDKREAEARVIGADPKFDLAILKIDVKGVLPSARTGDSDTLMIGETAIAIGNPYGLNHTVTTGVIGAVGRTIKTEEGRIFSDFIQTDASINPGNSGGPLVILTGEVIGINTAIYANAEGIGFAIPINRAMRAVADLIRFGKIEKTWSGIRVQELTPRLRASLPGAEAGKGVLVADVIKDSPASGAGLVSGDIIVKVDDVDISTMESLLDKLGGYMVGDTAAVELIRDGKRKTVRIKMTGLPIDRADKLAKDLLGLTVKGIGRAEITRWRLGADRGVVVTDVDGNSPAERIGIQPGDVIRQLGTREILTADDFREAAVMASVQESVFLIVQRGRFLYHVRM